MDINQITPQPIESGVKKSLYKEYKFEDHIWKSNPSILLPPAYYAMFGKMFNGLLEFAKICVYMKTKYYVFYGDRGWIKYDNKSTVKKAVLNTFRGQTFGGWTFDDAFNDAFFEGTITLALPAMAGSKADSGTFSIGSCPDFDGYMSLPLCPTFITVDNKRYVNTWKPSRLIQNTQYADDGAELLWLIYRSLCNGKEINKDRIEERNLIAQEVLNGTYLNNPTFKWVIMWLAVQVQRPGINLLSNLWLLGELQGIGKGTLVQVMNFIIGRHNIAKLNQTEVEAGWTDHLLGASLVEIDELEPGAGKLMEKAALKFWETWIKSHTNSEYSNFLERNVGKHEFIINTSNFIFTTNNEQPVAVNPSDRRNFFVKTTSNPEFVHHAAAFQEVIFKHRPYEAAAGFMSFLVRVKVDYMFINTVFITDIKADIIDATKSIVEQWIENDPTFRYGIHGSTEMLAKFNKWAEDNNEDTMNQTVFGRNMKKLNPRVFTVTKFKHAVTRNVMYDIQDNVVNTSKGKQRAQYIAELEESKKLKSERVVVADAEIEHTMSIAPKKSLAHMRAALKLIQE